MNNTASLSAPESHIEFLRAENDRLLKRAESMQRFIATFPALILKARLDAKEGRNTNYNYVIHNETQSPL